MKLCANKFCLLKFSVRSAKNLSRVGTTFTRHGSGAQLRALHKDVKRPGSGTALNSRANRLADLRQPRLSLYERDGIGVYAQSSSRTPISGKVHGLIGSREANTN